MNILIGVTGSVATIKLPELISSLQMHFPQANIKVVATEKALYFIPEKLQQSISVPLLLDDYEWLQWTKRGDPVMHIELRKWADVAIVAPMDANTMAKAANGICDNFLTSILRAWDFKKPLLACPAMNTAMWDHPITAKHLIDLQNFGYRFIDPIEKTLICGDHGIGAMADVTTIISELKRIVAFQQ